MSELNIYQRINAIQKDVKYIQKDATVQGYKAVTHDMVTAKLRDSCVKHGVLVIPSQVKGKFQINQTKSGGNMLLYTGKYEVSFVNIDKPEDKLVITASAQANDTGDKATGKALSYVVKNTMLKVFMLETGVNEESRVKNERDMTQKIDKADINWIESALEKISDEEGKTSKERLMEWLEKKRITRLEDINESLFIEVESILRALMKKAEALKDA